MNRELWMYYFIRTITYPCRWMHYRILHLIGKGLGRLAFYFIPRYRKRALSNLALAKDLHLESEERLLEIAKQSFENLAINVLEYSRFSCEKDFAKVISCENPQVADELYQKGTGIIFFCGHQSNWEVLFLEGTTRMQGIAIGRPIKNQLLYNWVVSMREKNGGRIVSPKNALKEGLRALRKGTFLGIVGDQGMPESDYSFPFLGRRAKTSTAPALLACKTHSPIIVATTRRIKGRYRIHYSDPIWPIAGAPLETEIVRLMDKVLSILQDSIKQSPGEWLWQHNRWKQQTLHTLYRRFRHDSIAIVLPDDADSFYALLPHLPTLKQIYLHDFLTLFVPAQFKNVPLIEADDICLYANFQDLLLRDYRFKLIFNFSSHPIATHYKKFSVFETIDLSTLRRLAKSHLPTFLSDDLSQIFLRALCRPGTTWQPEISHAP